MTAHSDLESAVSSYQTGAFGIYQNHSILMKLLALVNRAILHINKLQQQEATKQLHHYNQQKLLANLLLCRGFPIGRLSQSHITVLINGESGTGKELVAHALHKHSPRRAKPLLL